MAKKKDYNENVSAEVQNDNTAGGMLPDNAFPGEPSIDTDFNLEDEYKPSPLIPQGNYLGAVTGVTFDNEAQCLTWEVTIHSSGIYASDGETAVDGMRVYYRNWLPKPGDDTLLTKRGDQTKRQAKINMLKDFADKMRISMNSPSDIINSIREQSWVGIEVSLSVIVSEYDGRIRNEVTKMAAA